MVIRMTRPRIEFLFDFASPNAYLVAQVLPELARRHDADVQLVPCLLGGLFRLTGNQAPMLAFAGVKGKLDYDRLEMERFIARHGLTRFRMNPHFPVNSLLLMRAFVAAREAGQGDALLEAGLAGMWEDGLDLSKLDILQAQLEQAGLDGAALVARAGAPEIKAALAQATEAAVARGVFGLPSFFVGDEMFFGKERIAQVEAELSRP